MFVILFEIVVDPPTITVKQYFKKFYVKNLFSVLVAVLMGSSLSTIPVCTLTKPYIGRSTVDHPGPSIS